jgi:hypothetical protein
LGINKILRYSTTYSTWQFETPTEVTEREAAVDADWETLSSLSLSKKVVLQDDLAREQFKEKVRLLNKQHINKHDKLLVCFFSLPCSSSSLPNSL